MPEGALGLLSQAAQCAATLSEDKALQLIEGTSDESQDARDSDSDEYHPSFTVSTLLAPNDPLLSTVAVSGPPKRRRGCPQKVRTES